MYQTLGRFNCNICKESRLTPCALCRQACALAGCPKLWVLLSSSFWTTHTYSFSSSQSSCSSSYEEIPSLSVDRETIDSEEVPSSSMTASPDATVNHHIRQNLTDYFNLPNVRAAIQVGTEDFNHREMIKRQSQWNIPQPRDYATYHRSGQREENPEKRGKEKRNHATAPTKPWVDSGCNYWALTV